MPTLFYVACIACICLFTREILGEVEYTVMRSSLFAERISYQQSAAIHLPAESLNASLHKSTYHF